MVVANCENLTGECEFVTNLCECVCVCMCFSSADTGLWAAVYPCVRSIEAVSG